MELTLQFKEIHCCETTEKVVLTHEETLETVIPEYCPDIARIVDTAGQLRVREKKLSGGRLMVTGTVRVNVLYGIHDAPRRESPQMGRAAREKKRYGC